MGETRKLAAILVSDVVGYSRLAGRDEELTLARLRALRSDLIDPIIAVHHGRIVKRTGDGALVEFRSVVDAVRCAIEVQTGLIERNAGLPPERRIEFRIGIHLGDVMEEADGDLMGDGVNIAARLEAICAPGGIVLSEDAYRQVRNRLDIAVTDLGDQELKNIAEPVRVYALEVGKPAQAKVATPAIAVVAAAPPKKRPGWLLLVAGIAPLVVIAAIAAWYFAAGPGAKVTVANAPAHLSIVVLPFKNLSNDPKQDYFADGITDNLTTDLSRIRNSFVIARNTAFTYKGKNVDAKEIGRELGVRYVLEGSVQRDGNRVRVNAQLIDAESGSHLWADRFEEDLADLFKLQDDVVARLANTLGYELTKAEAERSAHSTNPDAIDLTMRGWSRIHEIGAKGSRDALESTRIVFEKAMKLDANNLDAILGIANVDAIEFSTIVGAVPGRDRSAASHISRALEIDPQNANAHYIKAYLLFYLKQLDGSAAEARKAIELDPNFPLGYVQLAATQTSLGDNDAAIANIERAMVLSPRDPDIGFYHFVKAKALLFSHRNHPAVAEFREAERDGFHIFIAPLLIASALALDDEVDSAKEEVARARKMDPAITISWLKKRVAYPDFVYDGLRKAGMAENDGPRLSIVVLPFQNLSGDPKQAYVADAITEELTTALSRLRDSFVIARTTAMTYKGKTVDVKTIGQELGVRYVLEGSAQRGGERVRVTAQLIDAETGAHLWADQFDQPRAELLDMQEVIVTRLARALDIKLTDAEIARTDRTRPDNLDAEDLALRCGSEFQRNIFDPKKWQASLMPCKQALKLDPRNLTALGWLAEGTILPAAYSASKDPEGDIRKADALVARALAVNSNDAVAHLDKAIIYSVMGRFDDSIAEAELSLTADPSFIPAYSTLSASADWGGRPERALQAADRAMRLSPRDPLVPYFLMDKGWAFLQQNRYAEAVQVLRKAVALVPNDAVIQNFLSGALFYSVFEGVSDDPDAAIREVDERTTNILAANPNDTFARGDRQGVLLWRNQLPETIAEVANTPAIPAFGYKRLLVCYAYNLMGEGQKAIDCADAAHKFAPNGWWDFWWDFYKGFGLLILNKPDEAATLFKRLFVGHPNLVLERGYLISALAASGQTPQARDELHRYLGFPNARLKTVAAWQGYWNRWPSDKPAVLDFRKRFLDGLRKAGMPEQ